MEDEEEADGEEGAGGDCDEPGEGDPFDHGEVEGGEASCEADAEDGAYEAVGGGDGEAEFGGHENGGGGAKFGTEAAGRG